MRHFSYTPSKALAQEREFRLENSDTDPQREEPGAQEEMKIRRYQLSNDSSDDKHFSYVPKKAVDEDTSVRLESEGEQIATTVAMRRSTGERPETVHTTNEDLISPGPRNRSVASLGMLSPGMYTGSEYDFTPEKSATTPKIVERLRVTISWENVKVWKKVDRGCCTNMENEDHYILNNCWGFVKHGQFMSIIGASGTGKTTVKNVVLLCISVLQDFSNKGHFDYFNKILIVMDSEGKMFPSTLEASGNVTLNKKNRNTIDYSKFTGFVQQDDILQNNLTVRECLNFAASIKCPGPDLLRQLRVNDILGELALTTHENTMLGDPSMGSGERKRASIGIELVANPALLFMDEPTSGMDSSTAENLVCLVKNLVKRERTILISIHQPSTEIFSIMDQLMILSQGKVVYQGHAKHSREYFNQVGYECPARQNPLEFFILAISPEYYLMNSSQVNERDIHSPEIKDKHRKRISELADTMFRAKPEIVYNYYKPTILTKANLNQFHFQPTLFFLFFLPSNIVKSQQY